MACPICNSPEGSAISDGIRAGAAVLILFSTIVIGAIARYVIRIWAAEGADGTETNDRTATP